MFLRPHPLEENDPRGSPSLPLTADESGEARPTDPRLEDYLDHVCAPLLGLVPYARRQELRAELRGHLEALVATHEELGSERTAAVVLALRPFGPPHHLSRQWAREWTHGAAPAGPQPAWPAMLTALGSFGLATLLAMVLMTMWLAGNLPFFNNNPALLMVGLLGGLLPALAGLSTGLLASARQALGTFYALSLLTLPAAALALHALAQPGPGADRAWSLGLAMMQPLWIPIGCAAAALGGSLRAHLAQRPGQWVLQ